MKGNPMGGLLFNHAFFFKGGCIESKIDLADKLEEIWGKCSIAYLINYLS